MCAQCVVHTTHHRAMVARARLVVRVCLLMRHAPPLRGRNVEGQCGVETSVIVQRPTSVIELQQTELESLHAGKLNSAAVVRAIDGEAWTWGDGRAGKLGHGSGDAMHEPCRVGALHAWRVCGPHMHALHACMPTTHPTFTHPPPHVNNTCTCIQVESLVSRASVVGLALGDHHSLFLDAQGGIWSCGENKEGQCGLGT